MNTLATFLFCCALAAPAEKPTLGGEKSAARYPLASSKAWTERHASHLLRRAGFGGTPDQILYLKKLGREGAVRYLVEYEKTPFDAPTIDLDSDMPRRPRGLRALSPEERQKAIAEFRKNDRLQLEEVIGWWIETMVASPRPLEEKLVLFWHGHFTSGWREVKSSRAMLKQNQLLRSRASGNLRDFLLDITKDPAMVLYLNTQQNRKGSPNENYARELMELFTMGPGHYTETDIKEAARAFTGITLDPQTGKTLIRPRQHDEGEKTFLGHTGNLGPEDIINAILEQHATAEFIARKFWRYFAYDNPEEDVVVALANVLRDNHYEIKPLLTAMFMSDAFYSNRAMFTNIKSPVELLVGTLRMLDIAPVDLTALNTGLRMMGQSLMQPPNVKGWDGGEAWITASTLFNRYNVVGAIVAGNDTEQTRRRRLRIAEAMRASLGAEATMDDDSLMQLQPAYDPLPTVRRYRLTNVEKIVDHYSSRLLQRRLSLERRRVLIQTMKPRFRAADLESDQNVQLIRGLIHLILSTPEYQLS